MDKLIFIELLKRIKMLKLSSLYTYKGKAMNKIFTTLLICCLLAVQAEAKIQIFSKVKSVQVGESGISLCVSDESSDFLNTLTGTTNYVYFEVNEDSHKLVNDANTIEAYVTINLWYDDVNCNQDPATSLYVDPDEIHQEILILNYDPNTKSISDSKAFRKYSGARRIEIVVDNIISSGNGAAPDLRIKGEVIVDRDYALTSFSPLFYDDPDYNASDPFRTVEWSEMGGADEYDFEWTFYDEKSTVGQLLINNSNPFNTPAALNELFKNNATRVSLEGHSYTIHSLYPKGYIFFRRRGVKKQIDGTKVYSAWYYNTFPGQLPYYEVDWHEGENINFQAATQFAENGVNLPSVNYFDDSGRQRQNVVLSNAIDKSIYSSTLYDYHGRQALSTMPAPTGDNKLSFDPFQAVVADLVPYDKSNFALGDCSATPAPMHEASGVARYYSDQNDDIDLNELLLVNHVPDAHGYPFMITEYTPDETGRIARQSNYGPEFQFGASTENDHTTKYLYGKPSQEELDRLFGNDAGHFSHYQKNAIVDPNGQVSVSYLDLAGRTIATSLAGPKPANLELIDEGFEEDEDLTVNLLSNNPIDGFELVSTYKHIATADGDNTFNYSIDELKYQDPCVASTICYDCLYDIEIKITDSKDNVFNNYQPFIRTLKNYSPADQLDTLCTENNTGAMLSDNFTLNLPIGEYTITKTLRLSESSLDYYTEHFMENQTCVTYEDFYTPYLADIDPSGCDLDCEGCIAALGTKEMFISELVGEMNAAEFPITYSQAEAIYDIRLEECQQLCGDIINECEVYLKMLLIDVRPLGQYARFDKNPDGQISTIDETSIFHQNNYTTITYLDEDGNAIMVYDSEGVLTTPDQLTPNEFIGSYDESWSYSLAQAFHPEWCVYDEWCVQNSYEISADYDAELLNVDCFQDAIDAGLVNADGTFNDPLFSSTGGGLVCTEIMIAYSSTPPYYSWMDYNLHINNVQYSGPFNLCGPFASHYAYDFNGIDNEFSNNSGPVIVNWTVNGNLATFEITSFEELLLKMQLTDPTRSWKVDELLGQVVITPHSSGIAPGQLTIDFGGNVVVYDEFTIRYTTKINLNLAPGLNEVMIENTVTGLTETIYVQGGIGLDPNGECAALMDSLMANISWGNNTSPSVIEYVTDIFYGTCAITLGTDCTPLDNEAWSMFVSIYIGFKNQVTNQKRENLIDCATVNLECIGNEESLCDGNTNHYKDKIRRIFQPSYLGDPITEQDIQDAVNEVEANIVTQCNEACNRNADLWISELDGCMSLDAAQYDDLKNKLIEVCILGCDFNNGGGSSSTANGVVTASGFTSFEEVLLSYATELGLSECNPDCNIYSIASMRPYDKPLHPGPSPTNAVINTCICENLTDLENCYNTDQSGLYNSFAEYLVQYSDQMLLQYQLDSLLYYCSSNYTEPILPRYYNIPAYLECNTCQDCDQMEDIVAAFDAMCVVTPDNYWEMFAQFANNELGFNQLPEDYEAFMNKCSASPPDCNASLIICPTTGTQDQLDFAEANSCLDGLYEQIAINATGALNQALENLKSEFRNNYINHCLENAVEVFDGILLNQQYHYTLYYYDQSGNLRQTIPPNGVKPITDELTLSAVDAYRTADQPAGNGVYPQHEFITRYEYNALGQVTHQVSPDATVTQFWYDELGRAIVSQDGRQEENDLFSYTIYDDLGRIIEVGELNGDLATYSITALLAADHFLAIAEFNSWLNSFPIGAKKDITRTFYDEEAFSIPTFGSEGQENLRIRVSSMTRENVDDGDYNTYDFGTHFSYDATGNVKTLVQEINQLHAWNQGYKRVDYVYDYISGNVIYVYYQKGEVDQFTHHYEYDENNRIIGAYTSFTDLLFMDAGIWDEEATYEYYDHGPLGRTVFGNQQVQGCDYAYTLQGWIKGVNSTLLDPDKDIGKDGNTSVAERALVGRDALGYTLNYFENDYQSISGTTLEADIPLTSNVHQNSPSLYNGNIRSMTIDNQQFDGSPMAYAYKYDQLNRIKSMKAFDNFDINGYAWGFDQNAINKYSMNATYDGNGNIQTLQRTGIVNPGGTDPVLIDDLDYEYIDHTNKLQSFTDSGVDCEENVYVIEPVDMEAVYQAGNTVFGSSEVTGFENVIFQAQNAVELLPGFEIEAELANEFDAQIEDCGPLGADNTLGNYVYDNTGNIIKTPENDSIIWDVYGKVKQVYTLGGSNNHTTFGYDPFGNRSLKAFLNTKSNKLTETFYFRDVNGNVLSTFSLNENEFSWKEQYIYGSSRVAVVNELQSWESVSQIETEPYFCSVGLFSRGRKFYELSNHLGNVLSILNDRKDGIDDGSSMAEYYTGTVMSANDYYPFGLQMEQRNYSSLEYRYGFNGKEKDEEKEWGSLTHYDYGARIYNPGVGKWLSVDPLANNSENIAWSPYSYVWDNPLIHIDPDGRNGIVVIKGKTATIKNTYYYTSTDGEKGAISQAALDYFKDNLDKHQADLMKTIKHGKVKINGKKYKLNFETKFVEKSTRSEAGRAASEDKLADGFQIGNILTLAERDREGKEYGSAGRIQVDFHFEDMKAEIPELTDGNTPFHEYLHNLGGEHEDDYIMGPTGPTTVTSKSYNKETMEYEIDAPVRKASILNIQNILDRASSGKNKRLKIIKE